MAFLQGIDPATVRAVGQLAETARTYQRTAQLVQNLPTAEVRAARAASQAVSERPQFGDVSALVERYGRPARTARTYARQWEGIQRLVGEVESVLDAVGRIRPDQWAWVGAVTGVTLAASTPLWATVPGIAPPVADLPAVSLLDVATLLADEASHVAAVALDVATYHVEQAFDDWSHRAIATALLAGLICTIDAEASVEDVPTVAFVIQLAVASLKQVLDRA